MCTRKDLCLVGLVARLDSERLGCNMRVVNLLLQQEGTPVGDPEYTHDGIHLMSSEDGWEAVKEWLVRALLGLLIWMDSDTPS